MKIQFKKRHCNGILLPGFGVSYGFTIDTFILTSVSASVYHFSFFVQMFIFFVFWNFRFLKGSAYCSVWIDN